MAGNASPTLAILACITIIAILTINIRTARKFNEELEINLEQSQKKIDSEQVHGTWVKLATAT